MSKDSLTLRGVKGFPLTHAEQDDNFSSLMYWSGEWAAGTYTQNEVVEYLGGIYICVVVSSTEFPHLSTDWKLISTVPGRGGLFLDTPTAGTPIGAGWESVPFDTAYPFEYGMLSDALGGSITLEFPGIWLMTVTVGIDHNESNSSRTTTLRLFNVTEGIGNRGIVIPIARNQPGSFISASVLLEITPGDIGDLWRMQIGGGDSLTNVVWDSADWAFVQQSAR